MPHPKMFDEDDPVLARVRDVAVALPEAAEKVSHGRPAFYTDRVFAYYGGPEKVDGQVVDHAQSIMLKPDPSDELARREDDRLWTPMYLGPSGWVGIDIDDLADEDELVELIDASYRVTAPARLVRALGEPGSAAPRSRS